LKRLLELQGAASRYKLELWKLAFKSYFRAQLRMENMREINAAILWAGGKNIPNDMVEK
jgi:hypothetical protein